MRDGLELLNIYSSVRGQMGGKYTREKHDISLKKLVANLYS